MSKFKDKEGILKATREKTTCHIQGNPHKTLWRFFSRNSASQNRGKQYSQNAKRKKFPNTLPTKDQNWKTDAFQTSKS